MNNRFHAWAFQNFPFMEDTFKEIDNYHLMMDILHYLKEQLKDYRELLKQVEDLEKYVHDYFDNLDVQEEIDNKIDELIESGEFQEIITAYIQLKSILAFDTVADMKSATNLVNGSYVSTLGYYAKNDTGSSTYKVRTITNEDVVDNMTIIPLHDETLIAEFVQMSPYINPKQFGAYGDGEHDDLIPIQKAINLGNVEFKLATYYVSEEIQIPSNRIIKGNNSIIKPASGHYAISMIGTDASHAVVEVKLNDIQIRMPNGGNGIKVRGCYFIYIDNINIIDMAGDNLIGIDIQDSFNVIVSNSRIYGGTGYTGQIGLNIESDSDLEGLSNLTNLKFDSLLIQNLDYGVKTNFVTTANTVVFDNTGFTNCSYYFYLMGSCMPIKINNTRMEGGARTNKRGFYVGSNIILSIDTLNAWNIDYVFSNYSSIGAVGVKLYGDIVLSGTTNSPKKVPIETSKTSSIYLYGKLYIDGNAYAEIDKTAFDGFHTFINCTDYVYGGNNTATNVVLQPQQRVIRKTTTDIVNVTGLKGCEIMVYCDTAHTIAGSAGSTSSLLSSAITMVPYKLYRIKLLETDKFTVTE